MVEVNFGHRRPSDVVAIDRVPELRGWTSDGDAGSRIGAGVTYAEMLAPDFAALVPALAEAARTVGSPADPQRRHDRRQPRHVLAGRRRAAGAGRPRRRRRAGLGGRRRATISVHEFMVGVKRTALGAGRADRGGDGAGARRLAGLRQGRRAQRHGHRHRGRLPRRRPSGPLGAPRPRRGRADHRAGPRAAEAWLAGELPTGTAAAADPRLAAEFGRLAAAEARPIDDHRSTAAYRRHAIDVLGRPPPASGRSP